MHKQISNLNLNEARIACGLQMASGVRQIHSIPCSIPTFKKAVTLGTLIYCYLSLVLQFLSAKIGIIRDSTSFS